jgi:hypothetical protein
LGAVFFPRVTLFGALRDGSESIDETNRVAGPKTRTLENRKGAAPATHNQIPLHYFLSNTFRTVLHLEVLEGSFAGETRV